jgi:2-polyprenyl-6-methoxyphenol hydroxylase-like FAD-dependent oxidoreductase
MHRGHHCAVSGRILVAGGGIAGLAAAQALHQRGIAAVVADRLAGPPDAGLAVNLPGNAIQALRALGFADAIAELGTPTRRREYRTARGRLLFAVDEDAFWGETARPRCVRRADLLELLGRGLPAQTVRWNSAVTSVRPGALEVAVELADSTVDAWDFVVGADGVGSAVRAGVLGDTEPRIALMSAASWRFMTDNPGVDGWTVWSGARGTLLLIPVDNGEVYGYASATRGGGVDADAEWLRAAFAGFADPVPGVIEAVLDRPRSLYHSPVNEVRIPAWSRDRVLLIGDAAHATAPIWAQGAALAMEDALVLAELLAGTGDWGTVGAEFERRRRGRVAHVQAMTDRLSRAAGMPGWLRDTILPVIGPRTYRETYTPLKTPVLSAP